jgi:hypothetical protein
MRRYRYTWKYSYELEGQTFVRTMQTNLDVTSQHYLLICKHRHHNLQILRIKDFEEDKIVKI